MKTGIALPNFNVKSAVLDNGLGVFVFENHESPEVSVQTWIRTGSIHEGSFLGCGLSHFLEHMIFHGSAKYPEAKIAETAVSGGGDINASTSYGNTVYYIDTLSKSADEAIRVLADAVMNPLFPEKAFIKEKEIILRERAMTSDNPGRMLGEKLWNSMFLAHPARHPIIGYRDKIESVDRDMTIEYHRKRYSPARSFVVLSGDIGFETALSQIRREFGGWRSGRLEEDFIPEEPRQACARNARTHFKDPLSRIAIGFHVPDASHEDVPALDILSAILGQNRSARLIRRLQEDLKLAIDINAYNYTPYFCGVFAVTALCQPEKLDALRDGVRREIRRIAQGEEPVRDDELKRTVRHAVSDFFRNLRSNSGIARLVGNSVLTYASAEYAVKYLEDISSLTAGKITEVAEKYLSDDNCTAVEMLPEENRSAKPRPKTSASTPSNTDDVRMEKLAGGQRVVTLCNRRLPLVDICMVLPGGNFLEDRKTAGISNLLSSMLNAGTKSMDEERLSSVLDDNAIDLDIGSGYNTLTFSMNFHKDSLETALAILASVISEPLFGEKEFNREKDNLLSSLSSRKLSPKNAAEDRMRAIFYGEHPYSFPSCGLEESVKSLDISHIRDFYFKRCLIQDRAVIGVSGDIDRKYILEKLGRIFRKTAWNSRESFPPPALPRLPGGKISETVTVPREQSVVMLGMPGLDNLNRDKYPMMVAMKAMNGMTSRLFKTVREKSGLAYYTGSYTTSGMHPGMIILYAGTRPDSSGKVLKMLESERRMLVSGKGISAKDFASSKACLEHEIAEQRLDSHSLIFNSAVSEFYGNGFMEPFEIGKILESLTLKTVNSTLGKYMKSETMVSVIAGPAMAKQP